MNWKALSHPLFPITVGLAACGVIAIWPTLTFKTYPGTDWRSDLGVILILLANGVSREWVRRIKKHRGETE